MHRNPDGSWDKARLPSRHTTIGPAKAPHRSYYYAMGLGSREINQPFVGVAHCGNQSAPCNTTLERQAHAAAEGVKAAGATPPAAEPAPTARATSEAIIAPTGSSGAPGLARMLEST
jgi:dihydroxyacid dehydratase/phosphogluconate dehydratase